MPLPEPTSMPILALSLANLRLGDLIDSIDAPTAAATKRKASCTGHHGLANDSSLAVRLVALSRLMRARDDDILHPAAQSPLGIAVLDALRAAVLRVRPPIRMPYIPPILSDPANPQYLSNT